MPTKADAVSGKFDYTPVPEGTHLARCYGFMHIGHVPNTYPGAEATMVNKIRLTWELPEEMTTFKEGSAPQPFSISQEYTLSMNEKANLRKLIQSWLGKTLSDEEANNFDTETLVGMDCLLTVSHTEKNGKTYSKIQNITKLPAKMKCPPSVNDVKIITWENMTVDAFNAIPKFLQDKMKESVEYKEFAVKNGIEQLAF